MSFLFSLQIFFFTSYFQAYFLRIVHVLFYIFTVFHVRKFALCMLNILGMLMLRNISQSILCSFALVMYDFVRWQHFITALSMLFMSQLTWICTVHTGKDRFCLFNMSYHRHKMSSMQCFIPKNVWRIKLSLDVQHVLQTPSLVVIWSENHVHLNWTSFTRIELHWVIHGK